MWRAGHFLAFVLAQVVFVVLLHWFPVLRPGNRSGLVPWGIVTGLFVFLFGPALDAGAGRLLRGKSSSGRESVLRLSEGTRVTLQRTYAALPTAQLQALLENPSDVRPGADDVIRAELKRRDAV